MGGFKKVCRTVRKLFCFRSAKLRNLSPLHRSRRYASDYWEIVTYEVPNYKKEKDPHGFHDDWIQENFEESINLVYFNHSDTQESIVLSEAHETLVHVNKKEDNTFGECKWILTPQLESYKLECKYKLENNDVHICGDISKLEKCKIILSCELQNYLLGES